MFASRALACVGLAAALASGQVWTLAVLDGREVLGRFGEAACGLDFNDDGHVDVFVGEPGWNRVHCWFGGTPFDTVPDLVFRGTAGTWFGNTVTAVGDLDGDGIEDLAIGAPRDNSGGAGAGRVFIHFGSRLADTVPDLVLTGRVAGGRFGWAIAGRGDANQDSAVDLLVGAPGAQQAYLFLGGVLLDTLPDLVLRDGNGDYFGGAVALPGDVTGDSCGDLLVGDYRHSGPLLHGGGCFLYHGGDPPDPGLDQYWEGNEQNRQLGVAVCAAGDLNGDGTNDLAFAGSYAAVVDLHWGGANINVPPDLRLGGPRRFGSWLDGGMDLNRDDFDDLVVGADGDDLGVPAGPGYALVFLGGDPMSSSPVTTLQGEADGDMFGSSLALLGDVNGDGCVDFVVGAPGHDSRGENAGRCYVYSWGATGIGGSARGGEADLTPTATVVGRELLLTGQGDAARAVLVDAAGRQAARLRPGLNDLSALAPGVYFLAVTRGAGLTSPTKLVIPR
ncbi:MAG: VCBS repeat-containing protein [bacterium]